MRERIKARVALVSSFIIHPSSLIHSGPPFAYVRGVIDSRFFESELRGRFWFNHFVRSSLSPFAMPRLREHWMEKRPAEPF